MFDLRVTVPKGYIYATLEATTEEEVTPSTLTCDPNMHTLNAKNIIQQQCDHPASVCTSSPPQEEHTSGV